MAQVKKQLAIDGGQPEVKRSDYKNWPIITAYDRKLINAVLDTGIVAGGTAPNVVALEKEWAEYTGAKY
jgi:dTDP-4-amino-4,6-dideoxygalactose transaminase